jgi:hypothetical protein
MDPEFKKNLATERVLILTAEALIEGTIFHHREIRLSDAINAPQFRDNPYLALRDAWVTKPETNQVVVRSKVLLVARSRILCVMPSSEVLTNSLPFESDGSIYQQNDEPTCKERLIYEEVKAPIFTEPAPAAPLAPPERLAEPPSADPLGEKRSAVRQNGSLLPVLITSSDSAPKPFEGWVLDRSAGGLRLAVMRVISTGTLLSVRPPRAGSTFPWIKVEVRSSTQDNGMTNLGCRFVYQPALEHRRQFG